MNTSIQTSNFLKPTLTISALTMCIALVGCGGGSTEMPTSVGETSSSQQVSKPGGTVTSTNNAVNYDQVLQTATPAALAVPTAITSHNYTTNTAEAAFFAYSNQLRASLGMAALWQDIQLDQVAKNHASYIETNFASFQTPGKTLADIDPVTRQLYAHSETAGMPGFTGALPYNRYMAVAGNSASTGLISEISIMPHSLRTISGGAFDGKRSFDGLVNSVYHREQLIQDNITKIGINYNKGVFVANMTKPSHASAFTETQLVALPAPNQTHNYPYWQAGVEAPNPVSEIANGTDIGGPISVSAAAGSNITVTSATLSDAAGNVVPAKVIDKSRDPLLSGNSVYIVPLQKLALNQTYTVKFAGVLKPRGKNYTYSIANSWSFNTPKPELKYYTSNNQAFSVSKGNSLGVYVATPSGDAKFEYTCKGTSVCSTEYLQKFISLMDNNSISISLDQNASLTTDEQVIVTVSDPHYSDVPKQTLYIRLNSK